MANQTLAQIRAASPATTLGGTELVYVIQGGADAGATTAQIKTLAVGAGTVSIASGKTLTGSNSGTLAGGDGFTLAIAASKTLTASVTMTLQGGDASVLSIAAGKTATVSNTLTLAGTDATTMTFPATSASVARTDAAQTFTGLQTFNGGAKMASGQALTLGNAATTGLIAGAAAALTNATIVITDSTGQAYRIPCLI